MLKVSSKPFSAVNLLCALLALVLLVLQFLPYWQVGEGEEAKGVSIQSFLWFPDRHKDLQKDFDAAYDALKEEKMPEIEAEATLAVNNLKLTKDAKEDLQADLLGNLKGRFGSNYEAVDEWFDDAAKETASMVSPSDKDAEKLQKAIVKEIVAKEYTYNISKVTVLPVVMMILALATIALCGVFNNVVFVPLAALGCGVIGIVNYVTNLIFSLGSMNKVHLGLCIALAAVALAALVMGIVAFVQKKKSEGHVYA